MGKNTKTQCINYDIISTLPQNIIETILCRMPVRDALRTSILSRKWRYSWRGMPKLVFTEQMVEVPQNSSWVQLKKYKLVSVIFHVLLFHNGPTILEFNCRNRPLDMDSEFAQIISYLAIGNKVKELILRNYGSLYKLPVSFFSLQRLELIHLIKCTFEPPLTFNGFSQLKSMAFSNVMVNAQMLQGFLSKCPLLEHITLCRGEQDSDFTTGGNEFTFVDLLRCVPLVRSLVISTYYMKYLCAGGMPHKLPTSPVHLKYLSLHVCMAEQNEISWAICMIRSTPSLVKIRFVMYDSEKLPVQQTPNDFLDSKHHSDLMLDHLETLEIELLSNLLYLEMEFVKLIMAKSPMLKKVRILLDDFVSVDEEVKMLRDLVLLPFPRASPSAKLIIER